MKRILCLVSLSFAVCLNPVCLLAQQMSGPEELDPEVVSLASKGLEIWRAVASANPESYGVQDIIPFIPMAELGNSYLEYVLWRQDIERYAMSDDLDPTEYAFNRTYVFPIVFDREYLGGVRVRLLRNREGKPLAMKTPELSSGNYGLTGFDVRGGGEGAQMVALVQSLAGSEVQVMGFVKFRATDVANHYVVVANGRRMFMPGNSAPAIERLVSGQADALYDVAVPLDKMVVTKDALKRWLARQPRVVEDGKQ